MSLSPKDRQKVDLALAEWLTKLNGANGDRYRTPFGIWLKENEAHRAAFESFRATDRDVSLTSLPIPPLDPHMASSSRRLSARFALAGIVALAVCGAGAMLVRHRLAPPFATQTALVSDSNQRAVELPGGPSVVLDAHSILLTSLEGVTKLLSVAKGRVRFQAGSDAAPAFVVAIGDLRLAARDCVFDVAIDHAIVRVTVVRGRLQVRDRLDDTHSDATIVGERQQLVVSRTGNQVMTAPDDESNWTTGLIPLDGMTLRDALSIGNVRGGKQIVVDDPILAGRTMQGQLSLFDAKTLAQQLAAAFDLNLHETDQNYILSKKDGASR